MYFARERYKSIEGIGIRREVKPFRRDLMDRLVRKRTKDPQIVREDLVELTEQVSWKEKRVFPPVVLEMEQVPVIKKYQMELWEWIQKRAFSRLQQRRIQTRNIGWVMCHHDNHLG